MHLIKAHKPRGIWRACAILRQRGVGVYTITYENISTWTRVAYAYLPTARTRTILPGIRSLRFAMESSLCRLCLVSVPSGHAVCLFSQKAEKQRLCSRITDLLGVPVAEKDGFSEHICERCKRKLERLEKAVEELTDFRCMANSSFSTMSIQRGQLKRTKETSSSIGVSPDTAKIRPPSKKHLSRRQLDFDQSEYTIVKILSTNACDVTL